MLVCLTNCGYSYLCLHGTYITFNEGPLCVRLFTPFIVWLHWRLHHMEEGIHQQTSFNIKLRSVKSPFIACNWPKIWLKDHCPSKSQGMVKCLDPFLPIAYLAICCLCNYQIFFFFLPTPYNFYPVFAVFNFFFIIKALLRKCLCWKINFKCLFSLLLLFFWWCFMMQRVPLR